MTRRPPHPPTFDRRSILLWGAAATGGAFVSVGAHLAHAEPGAPPSSSGSGAVAPPGGIGTAAPERRDVLTVGIANNHGHELVVTLGDIAAGKPKTYDIAGGSGHSHEVTLTPDDFAAIARGVDLRVASTAVSNHRHTVRVRCESEAEIRARQSVCSTFVPGIDNHELIVTAADIDAGREKTFDIQGISLHTHRLTLRDDDFRALHARKTVRRYASATDDHTHLVVIRYQKK